MRNQNYQYMTRRIGNTIFKVKVVFGDTETETMEDKIFDWFATKCWKKTRMMVQWRHHK